AHTAAIGLRHSAWVCRRSTTFRCGFRLSGAFRRNGGRSRSCRTTSWGRSSSTRRSLVAPCRRLRPRRSTVPAATTATAFSIPMAWRGRCRRSGMRSSMPFVWTFGKWHRRSSSNWTSSKSTSVACGRSRTWPATVTTGRSSCGSSSRSFSARTPTARSTTTRRPPSRRPFVRSWTAFAQTFQDCRAAAATALRLTSGHMLGRSIEGLLLVRAPEPRPFYDDRQFYDDRRGYAPDDRRYDPRDDRRYGPPPVLGRSMSKQAGSGEAAGSLGLSEFSGFQQFWFRSFAETQIATFVPCPSALCS
ncbi:unnamed protein product, partial [Symbiodinium sp. CCMP2592]